MKKDISVFIINIILVISITAGAVLTSGRVSSGIIAFNEGIAAAFSPVYIMDNINNKNNTDNIKQTGNNNSTTSAAAENVSRNINEDSKIYSDITDVPDDIKKLMAAAEKSIKSEKKKGKTSEEDYFGGGELVSFNDLEIQSKIPSSFYKLNIEKLLKEKVKLNIADKSKPTILVYHSHTTESYTLLDVGYYTKSLDLRSDDEGKNMVRVGDDLCSYLEKIGYGVIHDREIHDESYNDAYSSSRKSVEKYLEKYPTIDITIDVHRDDITYSNGTKVKPTAVINKKKAARMMIIAGAEYGRIEKFPDWERNLTFDIMVQSKVNEMYPGLMRPILFSERKYNMDETPYSFLLEVGTDANTLDEACYSARLFATALGKALDEAGGGDKEK